MSFINSKSVFLGTRGGKAGIEPLLLPVASDCKLGTSAEEEDDVGDTSCFGMEDSEC